MRTARLLTVSFVSRGKESVNPPDGDRPPSLGTDAAAALDADPHLVM